ncbi:TAXI family TRAP transporter solute-binding subunit [Pseudogracilibacillus sp. SE30717A]|uniref:TAXI family TRAP transporter solute-binding subunit n=1 Tax=Pseudogracilibacillus sp. SE30717A TaxID=3098293 RepID=UPI00300E3679
MKKILILLTVVISALIITACGDSTGKDNNASNDSSSDTKSSLTWASGAQGGGWYTTAGGLSSLILDETGINISTIPGGSLQNMPFIATNEAQLAWMQPPFISAGLNGEDPFEEKFENVSIIGNGFGTNHFHFVVDASIKADTVDELFANKKDLNIVVTPVNNSDEWVFRKILDFYDTSYEDIKNAGGKVSHGSYDEQSDALRNGNATEVFAQLALPAASITEVAVNKDVKILPMSEELIDYLTEFGLDKNPIPAGTYENVVNGDEEIPTASMGNVLTVYSGIDDETVYQITKAINENIDQLPNIHGSLEYYSLENATKNLVGPLHPGAKKYYEEVGELNE